MTVKESTPQHQKHEENRVSYLGYHRVLGDRITL